MSQKRTITFSVLLIVVLTSVLYFPSLNYSFYPNLDDGKLILQNKTVTDFPKEGSSVFTEFVYGLYHPATTLSFIFDYMFSGNNPFGYRLHNLLLHIANALLVFYLLVKLFRQIPLSTIGSLLFALHPLRVESVVWVSERKDVLYAFWFLLSLLAYLRFRDKGLTRWYLLAGIFFILSLLSKVSAIVLPAILLLIDWYLDKAFSRKSIYRMLPWFILSVVFGVVNIKAQQSIDFFQPLTDKYSFIQLLSFPFYSFAYYASQFVLPVALSTKHLFPRIIEGGIDSLYYLGIPFSALFIWTIWHWRKNSLYLLGMGMYVVSIFIVLKFVPTGNDIVSERYSYIPHLGLIIAISGLLIPVIEKRKWNNSIIFIVALIISVVFMATSFGYLKNWKNEVAIWSRVINQEPEMALAYNERGIAWKEQENYADAAKDFTFAYQLDPQMTMALNNRGKCFEKLGQEVEAEKDFDAFISANPNVYEGYFNRAYLLFRQKKWEQALPDFLKLHEFYGQHSPVILNIARCYSTTANPEKAIVFYEEYLSMEPSKTEIAIEFGRLLLSIGEQDKAIEVFTGVLKQNSNNGEVNYYLGNLYAKAEKYEMAITYYNEAIRLSPSYPGAYMNRGNVYYFKKQKQQACADWNKALELGLKEALQMIEENCH